jgi:hypothetical protein
MNLFLEIKFQKSECHFFRAENSTFYADSLNEAERRLENVMGA